ncbi:tyrosine-type recombinase/integrase [Sinomonas sp. ASV486]|uniref:tyrosine-type recombinase/integrase n=1 Tax=Sinomonas sp. ASV486 TaxID=3051170 RepID=UPI0027DDDC84|nr:tyrosine-type recombinase/integrase [Sinomonas sp. ASV486]MDQ4490794.1 tyrosine-type recombinase/integrase [Sinomonas sp. ASV486]
MAGFMRVQAMALPNTDERSYTVVDAGMRPVKPVEAFLAHLQRTSYSPNTVKGYAHDLKDLFWWLDETEKDWRALGLQDIGEWVGWLRTPVKYRGKGVAVLPRAAPSLRERSLERKLAAVSAFYDFQRRHDALVDLQMSRWVAGAGRGRFKPFLDHAMSGAVRREIRLRGVTRPAPKVIAREDIARVLAACGRHRDRLLIGTLFETGMRVGEVLGLRHSDLSISRQEVDIVPRENSNGARVKGQKARSVPVNAQLFTLYADYIDEECGSVDSDYVFVNLWGGRRGHPVTYSGVRDLVLRLRVLTGLENFTPHQLRHTYATELIRRGTDWAVVQRLMGHASIQTTLGIYGHLTAADARAALTDAGWFESAWPGTPTGEEGL